MRLVAFDERQERRLRVASARPGEQLGGREVGDDPTGPQQEEAVGAWLDTSRVAPASAMALKTSHSSARSTGSSPTVGSSNTISSGFPSIAVARETRFSWPPLNEPTV